MRKNLRQKGVGLVEIVVATAIITLIVLSVISAYLVHFRAGIEVVGRIQATLLAEEAIEAVKFLRDESWSSNIDVLSLGVPYHIATTSAGYEATAVPTPLLSKFYRTATFSPVNRDANGDIVESGGTLDEGTRKVSVAVEWLAASGSTTKSMSTYITDLFDN